VTRLPAVAQIAIWAEIETIFAARFYDGWFGWIGSTTSLGWLLAGLALEFLGLIAGPAWLVAMTITGIRRARAARAGWRVIAAWGALAAAGAALEAALWRGIGYWPDGVPRPAGQAMLWAGFAAVGVGAIIVATRPWRVRPSARSLRLAWRSDRAACLTLAGALLVLAVCAPAFAETELANVRSVHSLPTGQQVTLWLRPGAYDLDWDGWTGEVGPSSFSVVGDQGAVPVTALRGSQSLAELGTTFLNAGDFDPAETFDIKAPGRYRVLFLTPEPDASRVALLSDPYSAVLARTAPWTAGIAGALAVMAGGLIRLRGTRRPPADASAGELRGA
jgi:hypothetical protein